MHSHSFRCSLALPLVFALASGAAAHDELFTLQPSNAQLDQRFGTAVAIDGGLAVVGAHWTDSPSTRGAAFVFDVATGAELHELVANDAVGGDQLGYSVAIDGVTVVAGAVGVRVGPIDTGAAYVFHAGTGAQRAKLLPSDPTGGKAFGTSVAVDGNFLLVGAPGDDVIAPFGGAAYLFEFTAGAWVERTKLVPADAVTLQEFGNAVALDGGYALVGCSKDDEAGHNAGAAYVFDVATGQQLYKLVPAGIDGLDRFGTSVDLDGGIAVISVTGAVVPPYLGGAVLVFDVATGQQTGVLRPEPALGNVEFGLSLALSDGLVLAGTWRVDFTGAAFVFDLASGQQIARLAPSDLAQDDQFGWAAALSGTTAIVSSLLADGPPHNIGAAYLFDVGVGTAQRYCYGDGSGSACPCANAGATGHGCANSAFADGAQLSGVGSPCITKNAFALEATGSRPSQPGLFFQGVNATNGGNGIAFGDGLRCAGSGVVRLEVAVADATGLAQTSVPIAASGGVSAGDVRRYQWWYRDPGASPCGSGFNLSNGLELVWAP